MPLVLRVKSDNRILFGKRQAMKFDARGGSIGRSQDNDWVFPDPHRYVSSRHAMIDCQGGAYYLIDTSRNGIYINNADTPVSRGHPQRLFDGDILRIGDCDIAVELTADEAIETDDAITDGVVRAQLVTEDESMEMQLMDDEKMIGEEWFDSFLQEGSAQNSQLSEQLPSLSNVPKARHKAPKAQHKAPKAPGPAKPRSAETRAVALILKSAGLKPTDLAAKDTDEVLHTVGQLLRHMVIGLTTLLQERAQVKTSMQLSQTAIQSNPLKISPSPEDALKYLLGNGGESCASAVDLVKTSFQAVNSHERAMPRALVHAFKGFMEHFAPKELQQQFDHGLKRNRLLGVANKLKYWELYEDTFSELTRGDDGKLPEAFNREFALAYAQEVQALQSSRRK
jgi:type VI secretion system FHA domain protein